MKFWVFSRTGNVTSLKALTLRHCPLESPALPVVQEGLGATQASPCPRSDVSRCVGQVLQQSALKPELVLSKGRAGEAGSSLTMSQGVHGPCMSSAGLTPCSGVCAHLSERCLFLVLCSWLCILSAHYRACLGWILMKTHWDKSHETVLTTRPPSGTCCRKYLALQTTT